MLSAASILGNTKKITWKTNTSIVALAHDKVLQKSNIHKILLHLGIRKILILRNFLYSCNRGRQFSTE